MKTLNARGHQERRRLINKERMNPSEAHERALSNPDNQSTFKQGRKK